MARPIPATTTTTVTPGTSATAATPVAPGPHQSPSSPRRWLLLLMVSLGLLLVTVDITILLTALPVLTHDLHASTTEGLWIVNAYPLFPRACCSAPAPWATASATGAPFWQAC